MKETKKKKRMGNGKRVKEIMGMVMKETKNRVARCEMRKKKEGQKGEER